MTGLCRKAKFGRRIVLLVVASAIFMSCAGAAQAQLSPYPSAGYPQANNSITAIVVSGLDYYYVGGNFNWFGGQPRNRLAAFDLTTGEVLPGIRTQTAESIRWLYTGRTSWWVAASVI